ncbi:MAG TPA: LysM peptidoglycan-binding domain-containing protein [Spirochaetota bacterium]|nr:LysM peptidoglycan-binding domain-containing protein [Spirochaetota bacterium]HPF06228.1 LysM peptidoglycan-binding domain-containing protein [Spirochaetota bacterium]HPJ41411.1 LysM peptidoglycan-binding domain-containing protein [Spirochaetota bacterium]HPR36488.1 LysM peptidoglycan-binding domain-containing protein [Spirochaetota bacterium]HRX47837.1 LysM peptidoglycan-binding domain-containing protein [Spirochaetota bacterium]
MKLRITLAILSILSLAFLACEKKIPIQELAKAKGAIAQAESVDADKYSPEEMKAAKAELVKAHDVIIKDEKPEDSAKNAETAYIKAMEAYNRSAVLYASDALKKADEAIAEADMVYAEKLSADNYTQARDFYNSANEKFETKDYILSHSLAEEAYKKAVKAKEESLDSKYQLQAKIDEVNSILARVEKYNYKSYAGQKYITAKDKVKQASSDYNNDNLKSGFEAVEVAKINADEAYKSTMNGVSLSKIAEAEKAVAEAENSDGAAYAEEDLAAAKEAVDNAKRMRSSGNYDEAITYSNEAIRLANSVIEEGNKAAIAARVKSQAEKEAAEKEAAEKAERDRLAAEKAGKGKAAAGTPDEDEDYWYYKVKTWEKHEECLSRIAEKYYKNAKAWKRIHKANPELIKNPDLIRPGWIIKVPKLKR